MNLDDYYYLPRSAIYSSAYNFNDRLPFIYGKRGDYPSNGVYPRLINLPCINYISSLTFGYNYFYTFGHQSPETIHLWKNGTYLNYSYDYHISSSHYEGLHHIVWVNMDTWIDPSKDILTAWGPGISEGTVLGVNASIAMENIFDQIKHFLTWNNNFTTSVFDNNSFQKVKNDFDNLNYKSAGIINEDNYLWQTISKMGGSFMGNMFLNNRGKLSFSMESTISNNKFSAIIPKTEIDLIDANQKEINLINRCPMSYQYSYVTNEFLHKTDPSANINKISQNIFGNQEPIVPFANYWISKTSIAEMVQQSITTLYGMPRWEIEAEDQTLKRMNIDVEDKIITSFDELYQKDGKSMTNRCFKVLGVAPDLLKGKVKFRLRETDYNLTTANTLTTSTAYDQNAY